MSDEAEPLGDEHAEDLAVTARLIEALQRNEQVLLGFVVVSEYATLGGERSLRKRTSDANGHELKSWHEQGYLHAALHTDDWDEGDDE